MATNGDMPPVQNEKINTDIVTLTRFLTEEQAKHKESTGDFTYVSSVFPALCEMLTLQCRLLCHALQFSFKSIAYYIRRATLINLTGLAGSSNTTGDDPKKLDVIGHDRLL